VTEREEREGDSIPLVQYFVLSPFLSPVNVGSPSLPPSLSLPLPPSCHLLYALQCRVSKSTCVRTHHHYRTHTRGGTGGGSPPPPPPSSSFLPRAVASEQSRSISVSVGNGAVGGGRGRRCRVSSHWVVVVVSRCALTRRVIVLHTLIPLMHCGDSFAPDPQRAP